MTRQRRLLLGVAVSLGIMCLLIAVSVLAWQQHHDPAQKRIREEKMAKPFTKYGASANTHWRFWKVSAIDLKEVNDAVVKEWVPVLNELQVQFLALNNTSITDACAADLAKVDSIRWLAVDNTSFGDAGIDALRGMRGLASLEVRNTKVTDRGLCALRGLPQLQVIELEGTAVTDAGLECLVDCPKLVADLVGTKVTADGVKAFRNAHGDTPHLRWWIPKSRSKLSKP
jgi:hypothetical protein